MTLKTEEATNETSDQRDDAFPIVGIGASAGGLDPIRELLGHLPSTLGLSFVIIQHLAAGQESLLPEILARSTKMQVVQVTDNLEVIENHVYVIPPGTTMTLEGSYLKLVPKVATQRPINAFFSSLALERKSQAIGIVLSGLGNDGTEGLKAIKAEGGITFAQEPKNAQYADMPRNAIDSQAIDFVLEPERIAKELTILARQPNLIHAKAKELEIQLSKEETDLRKILMLVKTAFGVDLTHYKQTTINRRITRRLVINKSKNLRQYVDVLRSDKKELQALFNDLLIGVTSFFREPKTFEILKQKVFPQIINERSPTTEKLRFWVPACSTGEEAYSLAIAFQEFLQDNDIVNVNVQIFGTDANEKSIEKARQATYPKAIEETVSDIRLKQFFSKLDGRYQISKPIRDMCVFAKHDITSDPPFSNLDLIICRNLLIYFDVYLQERVLPVLHYGLKPDGFLVLGESESVGKFQYLFEPLTTKSAIFKKKRAQPQATIETGTFVPYATKKTCNPPQKIDAMTSLKQEVDSELIEQYVPATLLTNSNLDILLFRGQVNPYLTHESGTASFNVNKIVKKELKPQVQLAILRAKKENKAAIERVSLEEKDVNKTVEVMVKPFNASQFDETFLLISFKEILCPSVPKTSIAEDRLKFGGEDLQERQIRELTEDLISSKQTLQSIIESHEATTEELRSTIEEAQSSNEALQSTNEELETAKEELQSSNEELQTLNEELKNRNELLTTTNDDLANLIKNVDTTVVIVDNNFVIRRATASAWGVLNIQPSDIGHAIFATNIANFIKDLETKLNNVTTNFTQVVQEVPGQNGLYYELRIRPYLTSSKKIAGAVLTFVNITERKLLELQQKGHTEKLEADVRAQEAKLIASERMAAIGKTAGMVGHDLRNPLQTVVGELYLAGKTLEELPDSEQKGSLHESIATITEQTQYMDKIVSDLQTFVKPVEAHKEKVYLKKVIDNILAKIITPNIKIDVSVSKDLVINTDLQLLKRVLINLVTNAIQAMPNGGQITIKARRVNEGQVEISVEDTGLGIPDEIKPMVFTPLFTTKAQGQGFGLAVCKRVIEAQGGTIEFESPVGKGAKFTIKLPITK
jgi:two-component system CheB/CheR fusion protein